MNQENDTITTMNTTSVHEEISVPWDLYDGSEKNNCIYGVNTTTIDWKENEENIKAIEVPIISKDDLDLIAHTFYLRKRELENLSYPNPIEKETLSYDCQYESDEISHVKIIKLETSNFKEENRTNAGPVFKVNNTTSDKEKDRNSIQIQIENQLKQQRLHDINPDNY